MKQAVASELVVVWLVRQRGVYRGPPRAAGECDGTAPEDDGRKPGDQQAQTPEQRHALTRYVDERAHDAIETYTTLPEDVDSR